MEIENNEMERLYAGTFHRIENGSLLSGSVVCVRNDGVILDIGYKADGFIPAEEFLPEELAALRAGDKMDVYVVSMKQSEGTVTLSRDRALKVKSWDLLQDAFDKGTVIQGRITGRTNGGLSVDVLGVKAFMPSSHADRSSRDFGAQGSTVDLKILKLDHRHLNIMVSARLAVEELRKKKRLEMLPLLKDGACLEGVVKNITDYGVFVDLGGLDGLLHISDISWGRISHPSEFFAAGDKIDVVVLRHDESLGRITLGYKQKKPDPWLSAEAKYPVGEKVSGKVVSIADYGAFIELEEGVEGLVHVSEIDWAARAKHPSKLLSVGETVEAVVLKIDSIERRISLSIKQLKPSPWEQVSQHYAVGQKVTGRVRSLTDFGAFVSLPEGVDGMVHISDISWTKHIKHPSEVLKKGQKVEAVVLGIEPEKERMALGLKQTKTDPWLDNIPVRFKIGDEVRCRALRITDFGIFVEMEGEVEGLVYASEVVNSNGVIKEGDELFARITKIDTAGRKIGLSMKQSGD